MNVHQTAPTTHTIECQICQSPPLIVPSSEAPVGSIAVRETTAACINTLPLATVDNVMAIGRLEFDERARESLVTLRRIAAKIPMHARAIVECNTELNAKEAVRDKQQLVDRLAFDVCCDLPGIELRLPILTRHRQECTYRERILQHVAAEATIPGRNLERVCARLAERGLVGSFEYANPDKTVAHFRYSRSIATDHVLSSTTERNERRHVESVDAYHNRVRTDEHITKHYAVETAEELRTCEHIIVSPQLNPLDAPIEQPAHVAELIRSFGPPYTAGLSLVTGSLLDFKEDREEIQRRRHTVRRHSVVAGRASLELTELGRLRQRHREEERRRKARRRTDPCVVFGRWCLVGWLPDSYDVSRFLDY